MSDDNRLITVFLVFVLVAVLGILRWALTLPPPHDYPTTAWERVPVDRPGESRALRPGSPFPAVGVEPSSAAREDAYLHRVRVSADDALERVRADDARERFSNPEPIVLARNDVAARPPSNAGRGNSTVGFLAPKNQELGAAADSNSPASSNAPPRSRDVDWNYLDDVFTGRVSGLPSESRAGLSLQEIDAHGSIPYVDQLREEGRIEELRDLGFHADAPGWPACIRLGTCRRDAESSP